VGELRGKGAIFRRRLDAIPAGSTVVFWRTGVARGARRGGSRGLQVFDATCPLVTKVHVEVAKMRRDGARW
jgi:4-hydroxy-3-methylbut-2-enyl diphosphate reductase